MAKLRSRLERRNRRKFHIRKRVRGAAERPRLSVFRSAKHIYAQAIDDTAGRTLAAASTMDKALRDQLSGVYSGSVAAATVVGKGLAERLRQQGVEQVVFDRGGNRYHGRVKALADGAREGGLQF